MSFLRITAGIISQPASGSLSSDHLGPRALRSERVIVSRSSPLLRPDPPVSPAPPDFTSSAYTGGRARQLGLGCERHLPCFGSAFLPHVPSPLRREESQGLIAALRPCSMAFPTKTVGRLLQCGRVPNDVEKASRGSEHVGLGSRATPDFGGYQDMGRSVKRDPEANVRLRNRGNWRQAASSAVGAGIVNAMAMSCQPSSFRKQICPEATRP